MHNYNHDNTLNYSVTTIRKLQVSFHSSSSGNSLTPHLEMTAEAGTVIPGIESRWDPWP
jgi:hypothetical protein